MQACASTVISLFPEMFDALRLGVTGRAIERGLVEVELWNPRDYADDDHRTVDDRPYGGGPGMVMMVGPLCQAIDAARVAAPDSKVVYLSPQGRVLDQAAVQEMAAGPGLVLLAGRYEGIDERLIDAYVDEEWSIGDYVLSGGELPAMVLMDAVIRLLPGVLGHADSAEQDSLRTVCWTVRITRDPRRSRGARCRRCLTSGNHELIRRWRLQQALGRTWLRRPDLLEGRRLSSEEQALLDEFIRAQAGT